MKSLFFIIKSSSFVRIPRHRDYRASPGAGIMYISFILQSSRQSVNRSMKNRIEARLTHDFRYDLILTMERNTALAGLMHDQ